jgi:hypothetical protein
MNVIEINQKTKDKNLKFIPLGDNDVITSEFLQPVIKTKIGTKGTKLKINGFWGTLGMANDSKVNFSGNISLSRIGNDFSTGEIYKEIEKLYSLNNELLNNKENKVLERFINFTNIDFPEFNNKDFKIKLIEDEEGNIIGDNLPKLRLTIFLEEDEGCVVMYEMCKDYQSDEKFIEYILPNEEPLENRDRLSYTIPVIPPNKIVEQGDELVLGVKHYQSFIIKVLTFKRNNNFNSESEALDSFLKKVNSNAYNEINSLEAISNKYDLLKFDSSSNEFISKKNENFEIDPNLKTLLLIHGTFVDTDKSFRGLKDKNYNGLSWLQIKLINKEYEQIIAFNYPTISEDAYQNVDVLLQLWGNADFSNNPIDVITTSRGGLVAKVLITNTNNNKIKLNKAALIACANGVGYFTTGAYIGRLLGLFRNTASNPIATIILGVAQYSVKAFLNMPGCLQMTIGDEKLEKLLKAKPNNYHKSLSILTINGDWDRFLVDNKLKRILAVGLDMLIKTMLGHKNDWVVGTERQRITYSSHAFGAVEVSSDHLSYLIKDETIGDVHEILNNFLCQKTIA